MKKQGEESKVYIEFSSEELWFLLQQFSPAIILGMLNPHLGWLIEEIEEADREALKSLVARNLVRIISKDQIELDDSLASMVRTCAHPHHTFISRSHNSAGVIEQKFIYFGSDLIVEHMEINQGQHRLIAINDRDTLLAQLSIALRSASTSSSRGKKFQLPEQVLFEASDLCSKGNSEIASENIKKSGLSDKETALKTKTLKKPIANSAFVTLCDQGTPQLQNVKGFALLEGDNGFWIMSPYDKDGIKMVEFTPANSTVAKQRLLEILP